MVTLSRVFEIMKILIFQSIMFDHCHSVFRDFALGGHPYENIFSLVFIMQFSNIGAVCQLDKDRHFS